jgi:hypothetical protein
LCSSSVRPHTHVAEGRIHTPQVKFACGVTVVMTPEIWSVLDADTVVAERKQVT